MDYYLMYTFIKKETASFRKYILKYITDVYDNDDIVDNDSLEQFAKKSEREFLTRKLGQDKFNGKPPVLTEDDLNTYQNLLKKVRPMIKTIKPHTMIMTDVLVDVCFPEINWARHYIGKSDTTEQQKVRDYLEQEYRREVEDLLED